MTGLALALASKTSGPLNPTGLGFTWSEVWKSVFNKHSTGRWGSDKSVKPEIKRVKSFSALNCTLLRTSGPVVFKVLQRVSRIIRSWGQTPSRGTRTGVWLKRTGLLVSITLKLEHIHFCAPGLLKIFSFEGKTSLIWGSGERSLYILWLLAGGRCKGVEMRVKLFLQRSTERAPTNLEWAPLSFGRRCFKPMLRDWGRAS